MDKYLAAEGSTALRADGFGEAIVGVTSGNGPSLVVYDQVKVIDILGKEMPHEDAVEYFHFNVGGAYLGPETPIFIVTVESMKEQQ